MARGRKRKDLGEVVGAQIVQMIQRGESIDRIAEVTGKSRATIGRRVKALKQPTQAPPGAPRAVPAEPAPLPESPEDIPEGATLELLDEWLETARKGAEQARADKNLSQIAVMGRLAVSLMEAKRKAAPIPVQDPNEHPDMKALGAQVAERLHVLIDQVTQ